MTNKKTAFNKGVQALLIFSLLVIFYHSPVGAQAGKNVSLSAPDLGEYPDITFYLDVNDRTGSSITNLTTDQITLKENGVQQEILDFQRLRPGVQLVVAFNISNPFAIQDINGISRFDFIKESILDWAAQPLGSGADDISIISNDGLEFTHLTDQDGIIPILEEYDPDLKETVSNFNVLSQAISIASDPVDQPGMKRVVLLYTSQPTTESFAAIDNLVSQAVDNQVQIYTILVSSPAFFNTAGAAKLQSLTAETGGVFLPFSGEEPLQDLGPLLDPLRSTYLIKYKSQIVTSGTHTLEVTISSTLAPVIGDREFILDVQPPNPIFIQPPRVIIRQIPEGLTPGDPDQSYQPDSFALDILLEFPDNHPRELEELIFRVDGEIVDRKTTPPYDQFIWDLTTFESSATHTLTLEAVDILGLSRLSVATPIEIKVFVPPPDITTIIGNNAPELAGLAVILLAGLALFIFISQGRIQPGDNNIFQTISSKWAKFLKSRTLIKKILPARKTEDQQISTEGLSSFRMIAVNDISQQLFHEPIRGNEKEINIGNPLPGPGISIKHPSVFKEHATITRQEDDRFQITDHGSTAGTWINYQQISSGKPQFIKDGDIIHIGEAVFRFQVMTRIENLLVTEEKRT